MKAQNNRPRNGNGTIPGSTSGSATPNLGNGHRRFNSKQNLKENVSPTPTSETFVNNKLVDLLARSCGKTVVASVSSGARYQGLLQAADMSGNSALSVVLHKPSLVSKALINEKSNSDDTLPETLVIQAKDLVDIEVTYSKFEKEKTEKPEQLTFRTDSDIASTFQVRERELQRWVPEESTPALSLEDDSSGTWDQFKVNEEKFGVESSYDEHLYTTRIDKTSKDYQERLQRAEKVAREIEGESSTDRHVLEERGIVDDSGLDEEDKYSGVLNGSDTRGTELMAALRNASISNDSSTNATHGKYATPRQRAAQYHNDPAIVSSSATHKIPSPPPATQKIPSPPPVTEPEVSKQLPSKPTSIPPKPQMPAPHNESFRLNAQSEINALREFSASFKVPHKMPNDLLPILAKDKTKQNEILKKQETKNSPEQKKDPKASFKLNPKAAVFTPLQKLAQMVSPTPPKATFSKALNNASPRMHNQRPFSGTSSAGSVSSVKRHHQISPNDFFGGGDRVPTRDSQKAKKEKLRGSFNMFVTLQRQHEGKTTPLILEKAFYTPPTWTSTVDESYDKLLALQSSSGGRTPNTLQAPNMPPMMGVPGASSQMPSGMFPGTPKFAMSPHMQSQQQANMAAHFQQQQLHAAMLYQQFQGGVPPQHLMYAPPGVDPQYLPPGGFMLPGQFAGSPVGGNMVMGGSPYAGMNMQQGNYNNHQQHNGRRYNNNSHSQNRRGGSNQQG